MTRFRVAPGLTLELTDVSEEVEAAISKELIFPSDPDAPNTEANLILSGSRQTPRGPTVLVEPILIRRNDDTLTLENALGSAWANPGTGEAGIVATPEGAAEFVGMTLFPILVELALAQGFLGIHASAIAFSGRGVLLPGPSGAGKSTIYRAAHSTGWDTLSEDLVWVRTQPSSSTSMYPCRRGRLDGLGPLASVSSAQLSGIVFPKIGASLHRLERITHRSALERIVSEGGFLSGGRWMAKRFASLAAIITNVPAFLLTAGPDVTTIPSFLEAKLHEEIWIRSP